MTVEEARANRVCRICGKPINSTGPLGWPYKFGEVLYPVRVMLNFGKEFAHAECIKPALSGARQRSTGNHNRLVRGERVGSDGANLEG